MMGFIEDQLLRFEGLTDEDIANLNHVLPEIEKLFSIIQGEWPAIVKIVPVLAELANKVIVKQRSLK